MNITRTLLAVSLTLTAGAISAEPSKFNGLFGQVGIGYESANPTSVSGTLSVNNRSSPVNPNFSSSNSFAGTATIGWYQDIAKGFLIGVGAEYSPFEGSKSDMSVSSNIRAPGQNNLRNDYQWQKKDSYNIFISPAMIVGTDGLAYAKIGFTGAKATEYISTQSGRGLDYNFTGYSLGLGYKHMFASGWYGFVEFNYADYGSQTKSASNPLPGNRTLTSSGTNGLQTYNGLVGIGYKF